MTLASDPQAISEPETRISSGQRPFPLDTLGDNPIPLPNEQAADTPTIRTVSQQRQNPGREFLVASSTPGARGIIQQRPVTFSDEVTGATENARRRQVAMGTSTAGKVIVPVVFAGGEVSARGRFAIEVSEPLMDIDGNVALEAGTVLITQLTEILDTNTLRPQVVSIVYRDAEGQVLQEAVEPGVLIIRGDDNRPLIAQVRNDESSSDLGQDLLVGTLSALGNIGAVLNAPDAVTTAVSEVADGNMTVGTSTTVTSGQDQDIAAAALEGFFTPLSERVAERFEQQTQTISAPYLIVPEGQEVSIFVNGLLEVVR